MLKITTHLTSHHLPTPRCTGSWTGRFACGWHQPTSPGIAHAGYVTGSVLPWIVLGLLVLGVAARVLRRPRTASGRAAVRGQRT